MEKRFRTTFKRKGDGEMITQQIKQNRDRIIIIGLIVIIAFMLYESTMLFLELQIIRGCIGVYFGFLEDQSILNEDDEALKLAFCAIILKDVFGERLDETVKQN